MGSKFMTTRMILGSFVCFGTGLLFGWAIAWSDADKMYQLKLRLLLTDFQDGLGFFQKGKSNDQLDQGSYQKAGRIKKNTRCQSGQTHPS